MQKNQFTTKVALITGAARRIGAEIARALHAQGFNVVLHYHTSKAAAEDLCTRLNVERDDSAVIARADLSDIQLLPELISQTLEAFGRLDVLVNNASRFYRTPVGLVTESAWDDLLQTNLKAPFFLAQAAAPHLSNVSGCIINIGDVHAARPMRDYAAYCISKAGLTMLTQVLAKEFGADIRVNAVAPAPVLLPEGENAMSEATQKKVIERTALGRIGTASDIAEAVVFFASSGNYITGQTLAVDGGRSLMI
jgi:pteridine reductase